MKRWLTRCRLGFVGLGLIYWGSAVAGMQFAPAGPAHWPLTAAEAVTPVVPAVIRGGGVPGAGERNRELWAGLAPEQRQEMRQQMRDHWHQGQGDGRGAQRQEWRERWQQRAPEERQRMREDFRERRGEWFEERSGYRREQR